MLGFALAKEEGSDEMNARIWIATDSTRPLVTALGWNPEGDHAEQSNLLPEPCSLQVLVGGKWHSCAGSPSTVEAVGDRGKRYRIGVDAATRLTWEIVPEPDAITFAISGEGDGLEALKGVRFSFPLADKSQVLPTNWEPHGPIQLPAVVYTHKHGQVLLSCPEVPGLRGTYNTRVLTVEMPALADGEVYHLKLEPFVVAAPAGMKDTGIWKRARRNWLGAIAPSARKRPGILANNVESDEASCSTWFYSDQAFFTPRPAGVDLMPIVRKTVDYWLTRQMLETGEIICYWGKMTQFLDANASPLISAWAYVESTDDAEWLAERVELMERAADYLAGRDIDDDGMVEAIQTGNYNTIQKNKCKRSCCWFDALNCGHKDAYSNALIYRAWRCMADLEGKLGRTEQQARYGELADRLKAIYAEVLFNPETGWLTTWKSEDGTMHDYASTVVNGMAIEYGLVEPKQGREILAKLRAKMDKVGFTRFDLGVPMTLIPVLKADYLPNSGCGSPKLDDGTDTFEHYMNGAVFGAHVRPFLAAHYVVGDPEPADRILNAMLDRQADGQYRPDFTAWDGSKGSGYEGTLVEYYCFLQAALAGEPAMRQKLLRPLF
jgi:hypothetical protein